MARAFYHDRGGDGTWRRVRRGIVNQLGLTGFVIDLSRVLPGVIAGWGVIVSPFGGVFRFDFLIVGIVFFVLDFACSRISRAVR